MKHLRIILSALTLSFTYILCSAQEQLSVTSPDQKLVVKINIEQGKLFYNVSLSGKEMLEWSPLGLKGKQIDLSSGLKLTDKQLRQIDLNYTEPKIKISTVRYQANELICKFENAKKNKIEVVFRVSDNNIAFLPDLTAKFAWTACILMKPVILFL